MRMIVMLVGLLLVGFIISKQLQSPSDTETAQQATSGSELPNVPTRPQDVPQFEQDINSFINQTNEEQTRQIDEAINP